MKKTIAAVGAGILGLGAVAAAPSAFAATGSCGVAPDGGTLTESNGVCTLSFTEAGSYSFTIPSSATELAALLVGGGNGANAFGYSGSGEEVNYLDLSAETPALAGKQVDFTVGAGAALSGDFSFLNGEVTSLTLPGEDELTVGNTLPEGLSCSFPDWPFTFVGGGAGGPATVGNDVCISGGPGVNPSEGDVDSDGNPVPSSLSGINIEFGFGGTPALFPTALRALTPGSGAAAQFNPGPPAEWGDVQTASADGAVIFAWKPAAAPQSLATTGSDLAGGAIVPLALTGAGLGFIGLALARKRRTAAN